jgi:outer membrane receptor protein involved in Fe transport
LVVIDGRFVVSSILETLRPEDIEAIEIIKDAPTASLYGSTTGNARIVITTRAQSTAVSGRPTVSR